MTRGSGFRITASKLLARAIATCFGCGYWPWGPGTLAAAASLILPLFLSWPPLTYAVLATAAMLPSIWASDVEAKNSGKKDPGHIVIDEVVGQWFSVAGATALNGRSLLLAFVLFRLFDIWKPPPVRQFEKLPGGVGIMADDVAAGILGALALALAGWFNLY